jgi:hypothetical protein
MNPDYFLNKLIASKRELFGFQKIKKYAPKNITSVETLYVTKCRTPAT